MRLVFISNEFPNPYEPTKAVFNFNLARALSLKHEVRVISPISWLDEWQAKSRGEKPLASQRCVLMGSIEAQFPRYYYPPRVLRSRYGWFFWQSIRATVGRLLASYKPDAVLGYWVHPDGEAAVRVARSVGVPAAIIVGGSDVLLLPQQRGCGSCVRRVLQAADAAVTVNHHLKAKVVEFGISPEKVHVWHQGVDLNHFYSGDQKAARRRLGIPVQGSALVWVGRMVSVKGLDVLFEACSMLRQRAVQFHLYLIGEGPLRKSLETESAIRGLSQSITFVGSVFHDRLPDWYRSADLTVLPSRSEGLPNMLRESLACGTAFVASRVGGIPEIARRSLDRLVPPGDPVALADAIAQKLSEGTTVTRPQSQALSWEESAESLVCILRRLVPTRPHRTAPAQISPLQLSMHG